MKVAFFTPHQGICIILLLVVALATLHPLTPDGMCRIYCIAYAISTTVVLGACALNQSLYERRVASLFETPSKASTLLYST